MVTASREFQVMVKPIGALCNLDCGYCYYLEKSELYPDVRVSRMADDLLEHYIVQHIEASPKKLILFSWHGGEPTILGLDYFRRIVALQSKYRPPGRRIINCIQTNGTLLDDDWCRFLGEEGFQVGLSLDGPKDLHDGYRVTKRGKATHKQVVWAFRLLKKHRVACDVLCVVHNRNVRQPSGVYRFFRELGVQYLQFLPLVSRQGDSGVSEATVPAEAYGAFLCTIFDNWVRRDMGRIMIQNFEEALRPYLGVDHALCVSRETCGNIVVIEHNGDFYSCDHFVNPEHRLGNIRETSMVEMLESQGQTDFGLRKRDSLPRYCRTCDVLGSCNGGCPKDRFARTPDGEENLNYLCPGLRLFHAHSRPYLRKWARLRRAGEPMESLMQAVQSDDAPVSGRTGRNDPCPCGSGRKYKKCCLGKSSLGS